MIDLCDLIGSMLSTDGTKSLLMNSPVWTRIFELDLGTDSSTTFAMVAQVQRIEGRPKKLPVSYRAI
jgi:hypothetical protein